MPGVVIANFLVAVLLLGWVEEANAQFWRDCKGPAWATATFASYHFDRPNEYEELNLGIGFEHVCGDWRGVGGVIVQNSPGNPSLYGGVAWMPDALTWRELRAGLFAGLFTGYPAVPLLPAGAFVGAWEGRRYGLNLLWFPPYDEHKGVIILQARQKVDF